MEENASCNFFLLLEQFKTPVVPYFSIFNRITPQEHLMSGFLMEENPSFFPLQNTLFLHIEQYKTLTVPLGYFSIFINIRPQPYLSRTLENNPLTVSST